jgi:hypothetical protein
MPQIRSNPSSRRSTQPYFDPFGINSPLRIGSLLRAVSFAEFEKNFLQPSSLQTK